MRPPGSWLKENGVTPPAGSYTGEGEWGGSMAPGAGHVEEPKRRSASTDSNVRLAQVLGRRDDDDSEYDDSAVTVVREPKPSAKTPAPAKASAKKPAARTGTSASGAAKKAPAKKAATKKTPAKADSAPAKKTAARKASTSAATTTKAAAKRATARSSGR
jgi:hypothetical protein